MMCMYMAALCKWSNYNDSATFCAYYYHYYYYVGIHMGNKTKQSSSSFKSSQLQCYKGDFCLLLNLAFCIYFLIFKTRDRERREFRLLANLITILLTNLLKPVWYSKVNLGKKSIVIEHHLL